MSLTWILLLLSLGLVFNTDKCGGEVPPCYANWFGSPCRYECHCVSNNCYYDGTCSGTMSCENGWFGPLCQYVDLVATNAAYPRPDWYYYSDSYCNTGKEVVTVSLDDTFFFTWLRLRTKTKVNPQDFTLKLMDAYDLTVECSNMYTSSVSDTLLDIHCQRGDFFRKLNITGAGVKWLCSVMVSGGRNVALGQNTVLTSVLDNNVKSWFAVDGNRNSHYDDNSCTHTNYLDTTPTWTLTFQRPHHVNRYILYNRDSQQERLKGFILEADQQNRVVFTYTDHTNTNQDIYRIPSSNPLQPVSSVKITATYKEDTNYIYLTLCEVEMFGDIVCQAGYYGRNCEKSCKCATNGESCFVSTGGCPSGCKAGYHWEECQTPCSQTYFGVDCLQECSTNCTYQHCNSSSGYCFSCVPGKQGPMCDKDCNPTFWGDNCATPCQLDCKNQLCNAVDGTCISCVAGKSGEVCDQACNATYHGENCDLQCSWNCSDQLCNATTGHCQSCLTGKYGLFCDEACPLTTFGIDCNETCSTNCSSQLCEADTGKCASCVNGSNGDYCDEALPVQGPEPGTDESPPLAVIVGPAVAFVVLVTLIVVGVLIWRRRIHKMTEHEQTNPHRLQDYAELENVRTVESHAKTNNDVTGQAKPPLMKKPASSQGNKDDEVNYIGGDYYYPAGHSETAIKCDDLDRFLAAHRKEFYQEQYNRIPANSSATTTVAQSPENQNKNRYKNISAYDHSRVHLQTDTLKNPGDYINASYINGYKQNKQFIASQGPTKTILEDFIHMLWEQEVEVVVMLTNLIEEGKLKCEQYWPNDGEINIGEITVKLTSTQVFADYTVRRLCLYKTSQLVHILTHFHFTNWTAKDVPTTAWGLVDLKQRVASITTSKPIVVHCSAGVGRTGTFIALYNILEEIKHTGYLDAFTTVQKLRQDRMHMVQTCEQYELLHRATQIAMVCRDTTVTSINIRDRIQFLKQNSKSGQSNLEKEFKSLCLVCGEDEYNNEEEDVQENNIYYHSRLLSNRMKNRVHNVLPKEYNRPILRCETNDLGNYINAVLVPSSKKRDHQILTQLPLPTTVIDFWRLVTQYKVSLIVAFERDLSTDDKITSDYLPDGEGHTKTCSFLNISITGFKSGDAWEVHRITINVNEEHLSTMTDVPFKGDYNLLHLSWKNKDLNSKSLLSLMKTIRAMKPVGEGRTLYTCRNGAEWSGLVCTLSLLLDRMHNDKQVSVPLVVGTVKAIRPQIVPTLDQYKRLYQVLNHFNNTNNEYSNSNTS